MKSFTGASGAKFASLEQRAKSADILCHDLPGVQDELATIESGLELAEGRSHHADVGADHPQVVHVDIMSTLASWNWVRMSYHHGRATVGDEGAALQEAS